MEKLFLALHKEAKKALQGKAPKGLSVVAKRYAKENDAELIKKYKVSMKQLMSMAEQVDAQVTKGYFATEAPKKESPKKEEPKSETPKKDKAPKKSKPSTKA